jgi:hypothetical protein
LIALDDYVALPSNVCHYFLSLLFALADWIGAVDLVIGWVAIVDSLV